MKKMLSRITAATLAAGMLVTEASASIVVPDSTDPGTIAGSGMWLVQVYNMNNDDEKENVDYGIDLSAVAGARFTFEVDLDNPDLGGMGLDFFEGFIGGGITLSCNGGDIYPYADMPDMEYDMEYGSPDSDVWATYNWANQSWWGCEFVNWSGETVDTNPNTCDDDPTNDMPLTTVNLGDYTYSITADFVNPLTCETDEWDINEIDVMQISFQEWGSDLVPIEITCCEILDADGNVLLWFDGQGNPSLENTAAGDTGSGSSGGSSTDNPSIGGDDSDDDGVIDASLPQFTIDSITINEGTDSEETIEINKVPYAISENGVVRLHIYNPWIENDVAKLVAPEDFSGAETIRIDFSVTNVTEAFDTAMYFASDDWLYSRFEEVTEGVTVSDVTISLDGSYYVEISVDEAINGITYLGIQTSIEWDGTSGSDDTDDTRETINLNGTTTTTSSGDFSVDGTMYLLETTAVGGTIELQPTDRIDATVTPTDSTVDTSVWSVAYNCFTSEWGGWRFVNSESGVLELSTTVQELMDVLDITDISEFGGFLLQVWNTEADIEIDWTLTITPDNSTSGGTVVPVEPVEPEHDGWIKFYMQNRGGDWAWLENDEYTIAFDEVGTYELSWADIQSVITDESGESLLLAPAEEWETYPSFGVEIGSTRITEVGQKGKVNARIEDITITLTDGTVFEIPARIIEQNLLGVDEGWGIGGYNAYIDFADIIMATLEIEDYEYFNLIKTADSVTATVTVNEFVPISTDEAPYDNFYTADTVEITDIKVADNEVTFSWTEAINADSYNIYLVDGNTRIFVAKTTELTYSYVGEYCSEYTLAVCGCAGEREGSFAEFTVITHHDYEEEYTTDREPTCFAAGVKSNHCKYCDARTNITEIETTDHDYSSVVVAPTYERDGYTLHMCLYCDDSYKTDITEMLALSAMTGVGVLSREANAITFKWDEYLGLDVDGTMLGYVIEELVDGKVVAGEEISDITTTQFRYTGLTSSTEYTIQIRAYGIDSAGKKIYTKAVVLENAATLPASMTGFAVTGRGSDYLTLSWNKNTTADGYVVQIQENNSWTNIAVIKSADTLSYKVTGLEPNSFYRFRMVAYKSYGTSKLYSKYTGAIPGYTAPAMVTGLNVSASTDTTMTVSWDENAYADGFILDIYKDGKWQQAADVTSSETSVTIEGLTASTLYKFRIKSYASNGSLTINSTYSAAVSGTTKPAAMSGVKVSANTSSSLTISWDKNQSATGYILQMYTDGVWNNIANIKDINTTSYVVTGLSASTLYKFRMVAYNNSTGSTLYGKYTGALSGTTAPAAVTNLRMTNRGTDFISVAWDKNVNATGYMVYIYDGTSWKLVKTLTTASSVSHKITGLESGKTYKVNVKAYKTVGTEKLIADASMVTATTL